MEEPKVAIISEDGEFIERILQSWRRMRCLPKFTVQATPNAEAASCAVVVTDDPRALAHPSPAWILAVAVMGDETLEPDPAAEAAVSARVLRIPRRTGWACEVAALAHETVLRLESQAQLADLKQRLRDAERFAALGKSFAEARHALGNALTGVLGNSELLLLEDEEELQGQTRAKVEMIRQMSLKIHETFHRLSSLDLELRRQAEQEPVAKPLQ